MDILLFDLNPGTYYFIDITYSKELGSGNFLFLSNTRATYRIIDVSYFQRTDKYNKIIRIPKTDFNLSSSLLKIDFPIFLILTSSKIKICQFFITLFLLIQPF